MAESKARPGAQSEGAGSREMEGRREGEEEGRARKGGGKGGRGRAIQKRTRYVRRGRYRRGRTWLVGLRRIEKIN